jgi:hypothetical protein
MIVVGDRRYALLQVEPPQLVDPVAPLLRVEPSPSSLGTRPEVWSAPPERIATPNTQLPRIPSANSQVSLRVRV